LGTVCPILSGSAVEDECMVLPKDTPDFNVLKSLLKKYVFRNDWRDISNFLRLTNLADRAKTNLRLAKLVFELLDRIQKK
jgi:hypothetical protein